MKSARELFTAICYKPILSADKKRLVYRHDDYCHYIDVKPDGVVTFSDGGEELDFTQEAILATAQLIYERKFNRPFGHWVKSDIPSEKYRCSNCGCSCWYYDTNKVICKSTYCPHCGARMEG